MMSMIEKTKPIVLFDSGVGGLTLLHTCQMLLPKEDYLYYGDTAYAPYGDKSKLQVAARVTELAQEFFDRNEAKALVLACNSATSAAALQLRQRWPERIIIGLEPAVKPAVAFAGSRQVVVLATSLTISQEKFQNLYHTFTHQANIKPLPCSGLMELIEHEAPEKNIIFYLQQRLGKGNGENLVIVLGCTHYIFIKPLLEKLYPKAVFLDGNGGAARHLERQLNEKHLLNETGGEVQFAASEDDLAFRRRCQKFLAKL